jgi:hypothetical protein
LPEPATPLPALFGRCLRQALWLLSSAATKQLTFHADVGVHEIEAPSVDHAVKTVMIVEIEDAE